MLKVNSISFSYQEKLTINSVSFELEKGKNIAITGKSGSGKPGPQRFSASVPSLWCDQSGTAEAGQAQGEAGSPGSRKLGLQLFSASIPPLWCNQTGLWPTTINIPSAPG